MLGDVVHYTFDATQAQYVRMRGASSGVTRFPGVPDPQAGTTLPAEVVHECGDGTVDLRVRMRGPGIHFVQNVPQGTAGQQGRWVVCS
ncbi:hypothetical protein ACIBXA_13580 [Micromonospora echinaurantiaca]|uniref:hypothetical protein n=1 Tax=Micromonospora TaxID=1873 RepID=UPI000D6F0D02|nr:hypothetical protein [Micromonospora sp. S4605]PWU57041.1 hypothetical protein DLJ47_03940 [Micromonospora sp. S4605]